MTRRGGTTLVEMLVVGSVFLMLLGIVGGVLGPGLRAWRRADLRSDVQGSALLALHRVAADLEASTSPGVRVFARTWTDPLSREVIRCDALAIPSASDEDGALHVDPLGTLQWCRHVVYYARPERGELWSAAFALADPAAPGALADAVGAALAEGRELPPGLRPARCVARRVRSLAVRTATPPFVVEVEACAGNCRSSATTAVTPTLEAMSP